MTVSAESSPAYDSFYEGFDSPLMRRVRGAAYGEDIGQHSWTGADELRRDIGRLPLTARSRFLDLGCGPGGPLTFLLRTLGGHGTGLELSPAAVALARERAAALGVADRATVQVADLNDPLPCASGAFEAALSLDVVLHLRDRAALFGEVARVLVRGGTFLFTDAGVLTGVVSDDEAASRSVYGATRLVPPGTNERALEQAGLRLLETEDRTEALVASATRRLAAQAAHQRELEKAGGAAGVARQRRYLETVIALAERRALSRVMYLAESRVR